MGSSIPTMALPAVSDSALNGYTHIMAAFCILLGFLIAVALFIQIIRGLQQKIRKFPR